MTLRIWFRPRPVAVRQACEACASRRAWLRANGIRRWAPYRASCPSCAARVAPALPDAGCRNLGAGSAAA
ncbi:MAG: hypothetical protein Q8L86_20150 [Vicinamibacterales bacterium]|nr:hypothetical protein [Vicinamibacterales bacterium]